MENAHNIKFSRKDNFLYITMISGFKTNKTHLCLSKKIENI